jgi:hypothetical protein
VLCRHQRFPPANPATAQNDVAIVNYCSLSRRDGALRLMQTNPSAIVLG